MNKRSWLLFLIALLLVVALSACERTASKAPAPTSTANKAFPTPVPGNVLDNVRSQTQTAEAILNAPGEPTAVPAEATATPAAATGNEPTPTRAAEPAAAATPEPTAVPPTAPAAAPEATQPAPVASGPIPTLKRPATYTLQSGEWPICIARRYDLNMADLLAANGLTMNSKVGSGTVLQIPQSGNWSSGSRSLKTHPTSYTVSSGDTLNSISCGFGDVSPEGIIAANGLKSPYTLNSGDVLKIP